MIFHHHEYNYPKRQGQFDAACYCLQDSECKTLSFLKLLLDFCWILLYIMTSQYQFKSIIFL